MVRRSFLASMALAWAAGSVAATRPAAPPTREALLARIGVFWSAWRAQDLHAIYLIYAPSFRLATPEAVFSQTYGRITGVTPVSYTVEGTDFSSDRLQATVTLKAITIVPGFGQNPTRLLQRWVHEDGQWYRVKDPADAIPPASAPASPRPQGAEGSADSPLTAAARRSAPPASPSPSAMAAAPRTAASPDPNRR